MLGKGAIGQRVQTPRAFVPFNPGIPFRFGLLIQPIPNLRDFLRRKLRDGGGDGLNSRHEFSLTAGPVSPSV